MKGKLCCLALCCVMVLSVIGCGSSDRQSKTSGDSVMEAEPAVNGDDIPGYEYGDHFWSDEPVTYTMFWSDHEAYPMTDSWELFDRIAEMTNVTLDISGYSIARTDYDEKKALMINSGETAYIIPKTYDESAFVDGGAVVAVSDWIAYMPNFTGFIEKYDLQEDLDTILKDDGKFYRLPGLKEVAEQNYTFTARKDIFDAAGYDLSELEKNWTWDDLYEVLSGVKEYMVNEGMCTENDYIWSDRWAGDDGSGGNILKLMGASYGVPSGWAVKDGMAYDADTDSFYFAEISDNYKQYVTILNKFIDGKILDPESFTQTDEQACQKFYRGEAVFIGINQSVYTDYIANLNTTIGEGNYELYIVVYPKGTNDYRAENSRLENGVMIASRALKELSEEEFIKMIRFIDWLFYSDEAFDFIKWGVKGSDYTKGETYEIVTDEASGMEIKQLLPHWYCGGLGIAQTEEDQEDMRLKLGYAGGVFWYGGTAAQLSDAYPPVLQDYFARSADYRNNKPLDPTIRPTEDENEQINLWKTPLIDHVKSWTLQFATGNKDIDSDWDSYVDGCINLKYRELTNLYNEIYNRNK